jgi:dolichol-phosphate mannosyltransferase
MTGISVIIPTYNEGENLPAVINSLANALSKYDYELIVVDDKGTDNTAEIIKKLSEEYSNLRLVARPNKMGLGSAYKDGFKASSGKIIVEIDADMSHSPEELGKLIEALNYSDISIGSRYIPGGKIVGWKWHRKLISKGANFLAKILGLPVRDATSGFRAYKQEAFGEIISRSRSKGFDFQVEVLYIAKKLGLKVIEIPVTFTDRQIGKSKLTIMDILNFVYTISKMRLNGRG